MDPMTIIAVASIVTAGVTTGFGTMAPALGEGRAEFDVSRVFAETLTNVKCFTTHEKREGRP